MKSWFLGMIVATVVLSSPAWAADKDEPVQYIPLRSYLGSPGTEQLAYITGLLDAWSMMRHTGEPKPWFFKCVNWGAKPIRLQVDLQTFAWDAARTAVKQGREDAFLPRELLRYMADLCFSKDDPNKPTIE